MRKEKSGGGERTLYFREDRNSSPQALAILSTEKCREKSSGIAKGEHIRRAVLGT